MSAYVVPILIAFVALAGSLGSQFISAFWGRRTKKLELVYARKADAYRQLLEAATDVAHSVVTNREVEYAAYLRVLMSARLVAAPEVDATLMDSKGLAEAIVGIRDADSTDTESASFTAFSRAVVRSCKAMNADLQSLL